MFLMKIKPVNYHQFVVKKNHEIELLEEKKPTVFWGPLYNISKNEFLLLKKTSTEYLDKSFIRINNSPTATPVFFVKNPGGRLRFGVVYRNFNRITKKDKKKLPLIYEIFKNIGKAK